MVMGYMPILEIDSTGRASISLEPGLLASSAMAASDPLESITKLVNGESGKTVSDYAAINSSYQLTGYANQMSDEVKSFLSSSGDHGTFRTLRVANTENTWSYDYYGDQQWTAASGSAISVSDNRSGTNGAQGDYVKSTCGIAMANANASAKVNAKVLQIQALETVSISFDYSVSMTFADSESSNTTRKQQAFFSYLITDSASPALADLKKGITVLDGTSNAGTESGYKLTVEKGNYLYLYFYGFGSIQQVQKVNYNAAYNFSATVSNFSIEPSTQSYNLILGNCDGADNKVGGGSLTVNGTASNIPSAGYTTALENAPGGTRVNLAVASTPKGYLHIGWRNATTGEDIFTHEYAFSLDSDLEVYALFVPQVTVTMGSSGYTDATYSYKTPSGSIQTGADQYVARNSAATKFYKTLAEAYAENGTVVLLGNSVLEGDFTIASGQTLSVPWDLTDDPATTTLQTASSSTAVSVYTSATINGTLTLNGSLVASGVQSNANTVNGRNCGKIGQLIVNGQVNVGSTGRVYAYGLITGSGAISVASGGIVYELMEIRDMRDFDPLQDVIDGKKAFPFNHYFVKTNECATTYSAGAKLEACYYINIKGITTNGTVPVIGPSSAMFIVSSGSLTKSFSASAPYNNKIIFRADGGSNVKTGSFSISIKVATIPATINTRDYHLPFGYAYAIEVADGGTLTVSENYKMLPGSLIDVKSGGTLNIASGKSIVFYRANDYDFRSKGATNGNAQGFGCSGYPVSFTKPSGLTYASNTAANVGSARLNVDGTLNVAGGLYVTNQLTGNTTYANGYNTLTGTGKINITASLKNGTIGEYLAKGTEVTATTVAYVPIKGITDTGTTADDGQTGYDSLSTKTWYGWVSPDKVSLWYTSAVISYDPNGGSGTAPANVTKVPGESFSTAENPFTLVGSDFIGWNTAADGNGTSYGTNASVTVTQDMGPVITLYAQWKVNTYTVVFRDGETVLSTVTVEYGKAVSQPAALTKDGYDFLGWYNGDVAYDFTSAVTADLTLDARWQIKTYTVTFNSDGGSAVPSQTVEHGKTAVKPADPTREGSYTFLGWFNGDTSYDFDLPVTADLTLTARWASTGSVTISWGALHYEYTPTYTWDPETLRYNMDGSWAAKGDTTDEGLSAGQVKVDATDYDSSITAMLSFAPTVDWSPVMTFVNAATQQVLSGGRVTVSAGRFVLIDAALTGKPTADPKGASIGSITITLSRRE